MLRLCGMLVGVLTCCSEHAPRILQGSRSDRARREVKAVVAKSYIAGKVRVTISVSISIAPARATAAEIIPHPGRCEVTSEDQAR